MHRGKVDPGVSELPRGNELSRDHVVMLGAGFIKFHQLFQKLLVMGGGEGHSNSVFYSVKLCVMMINFSLQHNVLCLSFVVVLYSMYSLYAVIKRVLLDERGCHV